MGHNIFFNETTKQHAFFSVQQKAWHKLGQVVTDYPTSTEAIQHAGLDYEVVKREVFTIAADDSMEKSNPIAVSNYFATIRTDNDSVLGVVGKDYEVVQNRDAFSFFDAIVGGDGMLYETAGALGKGERIFITAKLPAYIKIGKDDLIEQYLFLTTAHDGSGSIMAAFTPVRIVCANTLNAAMKNSSNAVRIKHTANAKERLEQAHRIMGLSNKLSIEMESIFNRWAKVNVSDSALRQLIEQAMAPNKETLSLLAAEQKEELSTLFKNTCEDVFTYAMEHETQQTETTRGTLFGVYNSVTGYYQNIRKWKTDEAKLKSILLGGTAQLRGQKAFDVCNAFQEN